jgi:hypothetical protein
LLEIVPFAAISAVQRDQAANGRGKPDILMAKRLA